MVTLSPDIDKLRRELLFFEAQANASIDGILVVDITGKRLFQNQRCIDLWKIPPEVYNDPDDSQQIEHVLKIVKNPEAFGTDVRRLYANPNLTDRCEIELKDGTVLDRYSAPVFGSDGCHYGRIWTFRDITLRNEAEEALRDSEERLRTLTASMPQIVFVCNPHRHNSYLNQRWVEYTGMSLEESYGLGWTQALHPEDQIVSQVPNLVGVEYQVECRLRRRDGEYRWFLIRSLPLKETPDGSVRWLGTCTDIHDLKGAEEALQRGHLELEERVEQRTRDLTLALAEGEKASRAKSEFLSRMSHELRTPLNAILGFGQLLEMDELSDTQRESVKLILKGGSHLLGLINEVLDLAKLEAGNLRPEIETVSVRAVVEESCALVGPLAANREVTISTSGVACCDCFVLAEGKRLKQVLINLLSNGIKYNRQGGRLDVSCHTIADDKLRIDIRDTGPGISPENIGRLFIPFERLELAGSEVEGSGLGLVIARRLVTAMSGSLSVESTLGQGSTFSVTLVRGSEANVEVCEPVCAAKQEPERSETQISALCIEDNPSNLRLIEVILKTRRKVRLMSSMQAGLGIELALEHGPDIILLDLNLPDMNGIDVIARLRQDERTKNTPVMVISADATPPQIERVLAAGAAAYLTKPLDVAEFLAKFDEVLAA